MVISTLRVSLFPLFVLLSLFSLSKKAAAQQQYYANSIINTYAGMGKAPDSRILTSIAIDASGNYFAIDLTYNLVVKVNLVNNQLITIAGTGQAGYTGDGAAATNATINYPRALAIDASGNLYIADTYNSAVRKIDQASGIITTIAGNGTAGNTGDGGPAASATLFNPRGLAFDASGNLYVSSETVIRKINMLTGIITTVAGKNTSGFQGDGGPATGAKLDVPTALAFDATQNLYLCDSRNARIRKIAAVTGIITTIAGNGLHNFTGDGGPATSASISVDGDMVTDATGNLYFADSLSNRIRKINAVTNIINTFAGTGVAGFWGSNIQASSARMVPKGMTMNAGSLVLTQANCSKIRKIDLSSGIITDLYAQPLTPCGNVLDGGLATSAQLNTPRDVAVDANGNTYIVDAVNGRIRRVNVSTNIITTVAGTGEVGFAGDGGLATDAVFNDAAGMGLDAAGNLYIADRYNSRIRKVNVTNGIITTVAGNGNKFLAGIGGPATAASFDGPTDIAFDKFGNMYFCCSGTSLNSDAIFKVDASTQIISLVVGNGTPGYSGDGGPASAALVSYPHGLLFDASGNLIFCDKFNNRIRKIDMTTGIITTIAGTGVAADSGDGGPATSAQLNWPDDLALDPIGNIVFADLLNNRMRVIDIYTGKIFAAAGTGVAGFYGDGGWAINAKLNIVSGMAIAPSGLTFVADQENHRIRTFNLPIMITPVGLLNFNAFKSGNNIEVNWTTPNGFNTKYFIVERRTDDRLDWHAIDSLAASAENSNKTYSITDRHASPGINYYRLKQLNIDGSITYSKTVSVKWGEYNVTFGASPNPFTDYITAAVSTEKACTATLQLVNFSGKILKNQVVNLRQGDNKIRLGDLDNLVRGVYFIKLKTGDLELTQKLVKL